MAQARPTPEAGEPEGVARAVCPECGTPADAPPTSLAWKVVKGARWWPWAGLLAALLLLALGPVFKQQRWSGGPMGAARWETGAGRLTLGDLRELAEGRRDGSEFIARLTEFSRSSWLGGDEDVLLRIVTPSGSRIDATDYGWPTHIAACTSKANFQDVFAKTGPIAKDWGLSSTGFWNNVTMTTSGAPATAADRHWSLWSGPVSLALCYVLAGWYAGLSAAWIFGRLRRRPVRNRLTPPLAGAAAALTSLIIGTLATAEHTHHMRLDPMVYPAGALTMSPASFNTHWTINDLRTAIQADDAPRLIALKFIAALPAMPEPDLYLDVGVFITMTPRTDVAAGFPSWWLVWGECQQNSWPGFSHKPGLSVNEHRAGQLEYTVLDGTTLRYWALDVPALANYILIAWLSWNVPRWAGRLIETKIAQRRRSRRLCVRCGYDLAGLGSAAV